MAPKALPGPMSAGSQNDESDRAEKFAWFLFLLGVALIPNDFALALLASWPEWRWERAFFGHYLFWPVLILGFGCCSAAPLLTSASLRKRLWLSLLGFVAAAATFLLSKLAVVLLFGA